MPKPQTRDISDIRVDDAEAAYHKLEEFTCRIMGVPKKEIDASLAKEKSRHRRKSH